VSVGINDFSFLSCSLSPHLQTPTQASIPASYKKTAGIIEKRLPAPTPQGQVEQIGTGTRAEWNDLGRQKS